MHWRGRLDLDSSLQQLEALQLLSAFGMTVAKAVPVEGIEELHAAAEAMKFPVALKTAVEGSDHKTELDGIKVGLADWEAVRFAYDEMASRLGSRALLQEMAPQGVELAFGCVADGV